MKRPALAAAVPVIISAVLSVLLPIVYVYVIIGALLLVFILGLVFKSVHMKAISGFMAAVFISFALQNAFLFGSDARLEGKVLTLNARVESVSGNECILKINEAYDGETPVKIKGKVRAVTYFGNAVERDDFIEGDFVMEIPGGGSLSLKGSDYVKGIYLKAYQKTEYELSDNGRVSPFDLVYHVQHYISRVCDKVGGEEGQFLLSLLTGRRDGMSETTVNNFRTLGLSHIMAVSGLHLSVIMGLMLALLKKINMPRLLKQIICIFFVALTCIAAGFSPSVCRAGIMGLTIYIGLIFGRQSESLNSLGVAFIICFTLSPFMIFDAGFILSCAATFGIIFFYPLINEYLLKIKYLLIRKILQSAAVCFCASFTVLPAQILYFGRCSWLGIPAGLFMELFAYLLISGGIILCAVGFIPGLSAAAAWLLRPISKLVLLTANYYGSRVTTLEFFKAPLTAWFIFLLFIALLFYLFEDKFNRRLGISLIALTFIISFVMSCLPYKREVYIYNENSTSLSLQYINDGGRITVSDCKGEISAQKLYTVMNDMNVDRCEYYVLGNYNRERIKAAEFVIKNHLTRAIVLPDIEDDGKYDIIDMAKDENIKVVCADAPVSFGDGGGVCVSGVYAGRGRLYPDSMYFIYKHNGFSFMNTYSANLLPDKIKADLVFCDADALEVGSFPKGCVIVNDTSLPPGKSAIIGRGYISECTLYANGKFSIKREKI